MSKNRKQELIDLAYKLFIKEGYDNVSVDEIITKAKMAKGTFYYYFKSKEEILGQVAGYMVARKTAAAEKFIDETMPTEKKLIDVIISLTSQDDISRSLNGGNNIKLCAKYNEQIIVSAASLLKKVVAEGNKKAIFHCNHIEERAKTILILASSLLKDQNYTGKDIEVFIDIIEKSLGAKKGTMNFAKEILEVSCQK